MNGKQNMYIKRKSNGHKLMTKADGLHVHLWRTTRRMFSL